MKFATIRLKVATRITNIKVRLSPSKKNFIICFNDSSSKMTKNPFHFFWKAIFVLKIFKFLSFLFGHVEKTAWLETIRLILKLIMSKPGWQTITINILLNISQIKGKQTIKFGQFIEYNKINILLQN